MLLKLVVCFQKYSYLSEYELWLNIQNNMTGAGRNRSKFSKKVSAILGIFSDIGTFGNLES